MVKKNDAQPGDDQIPDPIDNDDVATIETPDDTGESGADEGVESLREQLAASEKARQEAETRATQREMEARRVAEESQRQRGELEDSRLQTINNAIAAKEAARKDLRSRLIAAKQNADFEAEADLNIEMADLATDLRQLNAGKNQLENRITEEREAAKNPQPQQSADPLENLVRNLPARSAAWVRAHPEVVYDPVKNAELILADKLAQRAGLDPASDAYFDHMDERMGYGEAPETPVQRRAAPPAAPPSRDNSTGNLAQGQIRLSRMEKEMADAWGMSYADYYKHKTAVARETQH